MPSTTGKLLFLFVFAGLFHQLPAANAEDTGFSFKDTAGQYLDVLVDGRPVARYMYAYDMSTPQKREETYKPYLHVFDAEGKQVITKGQGGQFTHHRGIFIGWMKMKFNDKTYDRWHMKGGEIVHQKFLDQKAGADEASFTSLANWNEPDGKPFLVEERTMTFRRGPEPARLLIDFHTKLTAPRGDVTLDGDPEHAGIQYRPANEVDGKQTVYVLPKEKANAHKDLDYPWLGETYVLHGKKYSVVDLNHPTNPKNTRFSAYRDYGRFGAFPVATIKKGQSLEFNYRFLIAEGEMPAAATIQKWWDTYAQVSSPSAVPAVSVMPAEGAASKPKVAKPAADATKDPGKPAKKGGKKPAKKQSDTI
jgi:hypothetical protein